MLGFLLVILSALFHAMWNVSLKKAKSKFRFNLNTHISSMVIFTAIIIVFHPDKISFDKDMILLALAGASFFTCYHLLLAKAYQLSDVSQVYPITNSSPLFVALWASIFLNESLSHMAWLGILMTITGCIIMGGASVKKKRIETGVVVALMAALVYSFGAPFDKLGVNKGNAVMYTYYMNGFMTIFFWVLFRVRSKQEAVSPEDSKLIWPAGLLLVGSALAYRMGLAEIPLSYGASVRQVSGLFGVIIGVFFFKEGYGRMRIIGSLTIVLGVAILLISA